MDANSSKTYVQIPHLKNDEVHVWKIDLESDMTTEEMAIISDEEKKKVGRLRTLTGRRHALTMRVRLRQLLSRYLRLEPHDVTFSFGEFGKPYVNNSSVFFNLSHSGNIALVAISLCEDVGIDIEYWRTIDNIDGLVKRNFSDTEKRQWLSVDKEQQEEKFFNLWSCKESFIKATGRGLGLGVSRCGFTIKKPHTLQECPLEFGKVDEWTCVSLDIDDKASASVIIRRQQCETTVYSFDSEIPPQLS
jgi:4'-phosphopantetheinyl transferase